MKNNKLLQALAVTLVLGVLSLIAYCFIYTPQVTSVNSTVAMATPNAQQHTTKPTLITTTTEARHILQPSITTKRAYLKPSSTPKNTNTPSGLIVVTPTVTSETYIDPAYETQIATMFVPNPDCPDVYGWTMLKGKGVNICLLSNWEGGGGPYIDESLARLKKSEDDYSPLIKFMESGKDTIILWAFDKRTYRTAPMSQLLVKTWDTFEQVAAQTFVDANCNGEVTNIKNNGGTASCVSHEVIDPGTTQEHGKWIVEGEMPGYKFKEVQYSFHRKNIVWCFQFRVDPTLYNEYELMFEHAITTIKYTQ
jgi:hypothetical protein